MSLRYTAFAIPLLLVAFASPVAAIEKYALLIGVNECSGFGKLEFAERDVTELARLLKETIGYRTVILMTNESAKNEDNDRLRPTQQNILEQLRTLGSRFPIGEDDHILVALSGHGLQFNDQAYFCATDSDPKVGGNAGDPDKHKRLIAMSEVQLELNKSPASLKLLLCDACRDTPAGAKVGKGPSDANAAFNPAKLFPKQVAQAVFHPNAIRAKGSYGFFSCKSGQQAYEAPDIQHSYFFYHVINGLRGAADKTPDGKIYLLEFTQYVAENVSQDLFNKQKGTEQRPVLGAEGVDFTDGPIAIIPERLVSWTPTELWKGNEWEPKGEIKIVMVGRDEKRFYSEIVRTVSIPDAHKPIEISFLLIDDRNQPFYMMKNKVSRELFHCFARQNPDKLHRDDEFYDEDSPWLKWIDASEATDPQLPAFEVTFFEAQAFAEWLGGAIPTQRQWDCAAGLDDWINAKRMPADAGPFQLPIGRPIDIALGGHALPVGTARDDFSKKLIRDMAGNGKEWTSDILSDSQWLRGQSFKEDRPLTFTQIQRHSAGIRQPEDDSRVISFRVVLDPLK